ncbi:c-type cytochrome [Desertivirga arenae]|uniref:c-type cytochrome n=1 Tax=Desertivirga arenae TaxID=2810309 RepID=UPI001A97B91F|nr:cytochrome c [Pedobacter sp. SYSU D00823]
MRLRGLIFIVSAVSSFIALDSCQNQDQLSYVRYYTNGKMLYDQHCQNCHNANGNGLGKLIPPLTDSLFLRKNKALLACIIKHGLNDSITINNTIYHEQMPGNSQLTDIDIAQIITYITNSFGNKQGFYDVSNAGNDLKNCRD